MTYERINEITFWVWIGKWPIWFVWEMLLLRWRRETINVKTLSQVAQRRAWQLTCAVYTDAYLLSHFVWTVESDVAFATVKGIIGWLFVPILAVYDGLLWKTPRIEYSVAHRWARWPLLVAIVGVLSGRFLFPQVGPQPWNWFNVSW